MITLNCPDCGKTFELDDGMAGKKAACECGAVLFIPEHPDVAKGEKRCPKCHAVTSEESILCVSCGYDFSTGGRIRSAETRVDPDSNPKATLHRRFWKPALLVIALIITGIVVYNSFFTKHYGISEQTPMGTLYAVEKHLKASGFKKEASSTDVHEIFGKGARLVEWKDVKLEKMSHGMSVESILVVLSPDDAVLAVSANFKGGYKTIPGDTATNAGHFIVSFWKDAGFRFPPEYKHITIGKGRFAISYNKASASVGDLKAEWIEYPSGVSILPSHHSMIITYSRFKDVDYKKLRGQTWCNR